MIFSVGIMYSTQEFLKLLEKTPLDAEIFPEIFKRFYATSSDLVLEISQKAGWIEVNKQSMITLTDEGKSIITARSAEIALRIQLQHLIFSINPTWAKLIPRGRREALIGFSTDVYQCFSEAGLVDGTDIEIIQWWDNLSKAARRIREDQILDIGRAGERLTVEYEYKRTGVDPIWQSIESNLSGFDVLSIRSRDNAYPLRIEVKASILRERDAKFHVSRNEWKTATCDKLGGYVFHLWMLGYSPPRLLLIECGDMESHIASNKGKGNWESIEVPYSPFIPLEVSHDIQIGESLKCMLP